MLILRLKIIGVNKRLPVRVKKHNGHTEYLHVTVVYVRTTFLSVSYSHNTSSVAERYALCGILLILLANLLCQLFILLL